MVVWLVGTATVTTQGPQRALRHDETKNEDLYLAKTGDSDLATSGDFFMATDRRGVRKLATPAELNYVEPRRSRPHQQLWRAWITFPS